MNSSALEIKNLRKILSGKSILRDISFKVSEGEVIAIIGPSGSGKTTLLKCINLLQSIDGGEIVAFGQLITHFDNELNQAQIHIEPSLLRSKIGMVFQEWNLWANKTILENIAEGPRFILKMKKMQATRLADNLCNEVNLGNKINDYPHQLSGGEKQRAAIARALAMSPQILMLDEITSALDPSLVVEVLEVMLSLKKRQKSLILVTHHIDFAKAIADKVAFLWNGTIHEFGEAEEVLNNPRTFELQNFLKVLARTY